MLLEQIRDSLQGTDVDRTTTLVRQALKEGIPALEILNEGLIAGMDVIGERFRIGEVFLPEVMVAARAMSAAMEVLEPYLTDRGVDFRGRLVIGTVKGDIHDIGKNLVAMMMRGAGFEVFDLGINTPVREFVKAVKEKQADLLCLSALLTTTMLEMKATIQALEKAGLRSQVKIMVGGSPVTQEFADQIGADACAPNALIAVERARELLGS
ncbi:MAG: corrinoid protein [Anaerolineae bacterium]